MNKQLVLTMLLIVICGIALIGFFAFRTNNEIKRSNSILTEFKKFEDSFNKTASKGFEKEPDKQYSAGNLPKVVLLRSTSTALINDMEELKTTLVKLGAIDRYDTSVSDYLFKQKNAEKLKMKLQGYKDFITGTFKDQLTNHPEDRIDLKDYQVDGDKVKWENYNFEHSPLAAIVTILTFMQNNVTEVKVEVLKQLK